MKLSIITICFNDKHGFERTARSVIAQTYKDFEWIIVDGGSTDGTVDSIRYAVGSMQQSCCSNSSNSSNSSNLEQLEPAKLLTPIVRWKSEPDKGIYNAMNKGIRQARGEYLLFMNSGDCIFAEDTLEKVVPMLNGKDVYIGDIAREKDGKQVLYRFPSNITPEVLLFEFIFEGIPHQATFIKRDMFEKYGLYREDLRIVSDWFHFYDMLVLHNSSIEYIPESIALYDSNGISSTDQSLYTERTTSLGVYPCQQKLFIFYRDNYEIASAFKSNKFGIFVMRVYFWIYRKFLCRWFPS